MSTISAFILNAVTAYGLPVAAVVLFLGSLGLPLPSTILVITLGAFVRENAFNAYAAAVVVLLASVGGDLVVFGLGRWGGSWVPQRIRHSSQWESMEKTFFRHAGMTIFLTRWLLTPLALPASLIAGDSAYPSSRFLLIDTVGEAVWIALFGGLGYAFSSQSDLIGGIFSNVTGLMTGLCIVLLGAFVILRYATGRRRRMRQS